MFYVKHFLCRMWLVLRFSRGAEMTVRCPGCFDGCAERSHLRFGEMFYVKHFLGGGLSEKGDIPLFVSGQGVRLGVYM
jgi:hypothetical protein